MSHVVEKKTDVCSEEYYTVSGFNVDDFLVDLYFWFEHSSARKKQT